MSTTAKPTAAASARQALIVCPETEGWIATVPGESLNIRIRSEDVSGAYTIMDTIVEPGAGTPLHYHSEDEVFLVREGIMTFSLDGNVEEVGPNGLVVVPKGVHHCWKNRSDKLVHLSVTFVPGGIEPLFERMSGKTPDELAELAASFGTAIVGPPLD